MTPPQTLPADRPVRAIGYLRVSTDSQADSGAGLDAQRAQIIAAAQARGWALEIVEETASGGKADRPVLAAVLDRLDAREADALIVAKLDRLSRSLAHGAGIVERAQAKGWSLVALDLGIDLSTIAGEMTAGMLLVMARTERRMIGQRTRDALAARKAAGVRLGRPVERSPEVVARVVAEREAGRSFRAIADGLAADGVSTPRGGAWGPARVREVWLSGTRA